MSREAWARTCALLLVWLAFTAADAPGVQHPRFGASVTRDLSLLMYDDGVTASPRALSPAQFDDLVRTGASLYAVHCTSCHGANLAGTANGPSLLQAAGAPVNFYLTTGRMPLPAPGVQAEHGPPYFDANQIAALDAFVASRAQRAIHVPRIEIDPALLQRGRQLFESNCEACHGVAGQGATAGFGWIALPLDQATPRQIVQAMRIGPGVMPVFTPAEISDEDATAIATYVRHLATAPENPGGTPFDYLGPVAEGFIGWAIGIGALFLVIYFTGTTASGARLGRRR